MRESNFAELLATHWQGKTVSGGTADYVFTAFTERLVRRSPLTEIQAWKADPATHRAAIERAVTTIISLDRIARDLARRLDAPQPAMPQRPRDQSPELVMQGEAYRPPSQEPKRPVAELGPFTILFLAANPRSQTQLDLPREFHDIDEALYNAKFRDRFALCAQWGVRATHLQGYLQRHDPDILHFSGHGGGEEGLQFHGQSWISSFPVPGPALARVLAHLRPKLRCVILNACHTEEQAKAIAEFIDCVIGTTGSIGDMASRKFSSAFYHALANGSDVEKAFAWGQSQLELTGHNIEGKLRLYSRCRVSFLDS